MMNRRQRLSLEAQRLYADLDTIDSLQSAVDFHIERGELHRAQMLIGELEIRHDVVKAKLHSFEEKL